MEEQKGKRFTVNIVDEGKQLAIRLPTEIVELLKINHEKDLFEFLALEDEGEWRLIGGLIKDARKD